MDFKSSHAQSSGKTRMSACLFKLISEQWHSGARLIDEGCSVTEFASFVWERGISNGVISEYVLHDCSEKG